MVNVPALLGVMAYRNKTQANMANHLNMHPKTFSRKLKKGVFGSDEIEGMIDFLGMLEPDYIGAPPVDVFFAKKSLDK